MQRQRRTIRNMAILLVTALGLAGAGLTTAQQCRTLDPPDFASPLGGGSGAFALWIPAPTWAGMCGAPTATSKAIVCTVSINASMNAQVLGIWTMAYPATAFCQWDCITMASGSCTLLLDQDGLPVELMHFSVEPDESADADEPTPDAESGGDRDG